MSMHEKIDTLQAPKALGPYSQAVKSGNLLFVSGQLPINPSDATLGKGSITDLTNQVIDNIENILKAAGFTLEDVVNVQVFLMDLDRDFSGMNEAYLKRFKSAVPPARTTIQVSKLPLGASIEIACMASK